MDPGPGRGRVLDRPRRDPRRPGPGTLASPLSTGLEPRGRPHAPQPTAPRPDPGAAGHHHARTLPGQQGGGQLGWEQCHRRRWVGQRPRAPPGGAPHAPTRPDPAIHPWVWPLPSSRAPHLTRSSDRRNGPSSLTRTASPPPTMATGMPSTRAARNHRPGPQSHATDRVATAGRLIGNTGSSIELILAYTPSISRSCQAHPGDMWMSVASVACSSTTGTLPGWAGNRGHAPRSPDPGRDRSRYSLEGCRSASGGKRSRCCPHILGADRDRSGQSQLWSSPRWQRQGGGSGMHEGRQVLGVGRSTMAGIPERVDPGERRTHAPISLRPPLTECWPYSSAARSPARRLWIALPAELADPRQVPFAFEAVR